MANGVYIYDDIDEFLKVIEELQQAYNEKETEEFSNAGS